MSNLAQVGRLMAPGAEPSLCAAAASNPLATIERIALLTGVTGDASAADCFVEQVGHWAGQLADPEARDDGRVRHLARMVAALRAKLALHETMRDDALARRDFEAVAVLDLVVVSETRRLLALLREHRHECRETPRAVNVNIVAAGARSTVNILAGAPR